MRGFFISEKFLCSSILIYANPFLTCLGKAGGYQMKELFIIPKVQGTSNGFTLIEFIIIAAAIVITLTLAVPTWSNYSIRANISEALYMVTEVKSVTDSFCQQNRTTEDLTNDLANYKFKASKYVKNIELSGSCDAPIIVMTTKATGAKPNPVLMFTGELADTAGIITWACVSSGENIHVPENCRSWL